MRKVRTIALSAGATALTAACIAAMTTAATVAIAAPAKHAVPAVPAISVKPGVHIVRDKATQQPLTTQECQAQLSIDCFTPDQVRAAYNVAPLFHRGITGKGSTILIVDSYGSPTIAADLHAFDATFGYPDPPSLKVIQSDGPVPAWDPTDGTMVGWGVETTLDVEYAHTLAPGANIVLDETPVAETEGIVGLPQINQAELNVINHPERYGIKGKVDVISQSFGATEETFASKAQVDSVRGDYIDAAMHGITVLASSGDTGATNYEADGVTDYSSPVTGWPASDPLVTGVGGTEIQESATGTYSQVAWNDTFNTNLLEAFTGGSTPSPFASSGGVSEFFKLPSYQRGVSGIIASGIGAKNDPSSLPRAIPDISMSGACDGSVDLYLTFPGIAPGWTLVCGTSEASPEFAGIVALADQVAGHSLGLINPALYHLSEAHAPGIVPVTSGNNTVQFTQGGVTTTVQGYNTGAVYNMVDGVGTVNAAWFVPELAHAGHHAW